MRSKRKQLGFWGAVIGAGASLLGGAMANKESKDSTDKQIEFQREMSNTSYQRAVTDMKLAGLNPMLAYSQGGASTPSGASYQANDIATPAVASAQAALQMDNLKAQNDLLKEQAKKTSQETRNLWMGEKKIDADTAASWASGRLSDAQAKKAAADTNLSEQQARYVIQQLAESEAREDLVKAQTVLAKLGEAEARAMAQFFSSELGSESPLARFIFEAIKAISRR